MSEQLETFDAKNVTVSVDDGGDTTELSVFITANTGQDFEVCGSIAEITKFATDLVAELILKGDCG